MNTSNLHSIMNGMARKPISLPGWAEQDPETETDAYLMIDPLLADLYKASQNASGQHASLKKQRGPNDPMTEVAADMADSAKSAFETRLLEIKTSTEIKKQARQLIQKLRLREERERREQSALYKARLFAFYSDTLAEQRGRRHEEKRSQDFMLFILWLFYLALEQNRNYIRSIANDFALASETTKEQRAA